MSIDTHWFSTLFGWYTFAGFMVNTVIADKLKKNLSKKALFYQNEIKKPFNIVDFNKKVLEALTIKKFNQNSSIKIKNFILDKNEKKLNIYLTYSKV